MVNTSSVMAGCINSVKMVIMPKLLFLFQTIPLDRATSLYIWNKKIPRIRKECSERRTKEGGLAMPNYMHCYWAANTSKLNILMQPPEGEQMPLWALMEQRSYSPIALSSLICAPLPMIKRPLGHNPVTQGSLNIWKQLRIHFGCKQGLPLAPISANALFPPSLIDTTFQLWTRKGVGLVRDFFREGNFMSFQQIRSKLNIPQSHFFGYVQVQSLIKKHFSPSLQNLQSSWLEECLKLDPLQGGYVSAIYELLQGAATPSLDHIKQQWEAELGFSLSVAEWKRAVGWVHKSSICIRHGLLQFKVLHRLHLSNNRLAKLFPGTSKICLRCKCDPGTLSHMFWACPRLTDFWEGVFKTITCYKYVICNIYLSVCLSVCLSIHPSLSLSFSIYLSIYLLIKTLHVHIRNERYVTADEIRGDG